MSIIDWLLQRADLRARLAAAELQIVSLKLDLDDDGERYANISQRAAEAEKRAEKMTVMRDPATVDAAALRIAQDIEDVFVRGSSSRGQRLAQVQVMIIGAVQDALRGSRDYNLGWRIKRDNP